MSTTDTTNYLLKKVDEGTEIDTWAPFINGNWDKVSTQMKLNADAAAAASTLAGTKAAAVHTHVTADVTGLDAALAGKAATAHTHAQSDITGLVADLAGKAPTSHTHTTAQVTGLDTALSDIATKEVQNAQSGNYTLVLTDAGKMVTFSAAAVVTVPTSVFSAGHRVDFINLSSGVVSFSGGTLRSFPSGANKLAGQYAGATIWFISASEYVLVGNVTV
jgi:hypothetical protein